MSISQCYIIFVTNVSLWKKTFQRITFKQPSFERINCRVYLSGSKRLDYKQLNETGEHVEKDEVEGDQIEEVSNLYRTISISEDLQSHNGMGKQKADALVTDESIIGEDIDDYIDQNDVENILSREEVDSKLQRIEELRTASRIKHNELKMLLCPNYEESYAGDCKKRLTSMENYIMKGSMVK